MGRNSGFVAATATLALPDVNFCLIPEADFDLDGENGLFSALEGRIKERGHAVIVVAEGAGQKYFEDQHYGEDASGNVRLGDIGYFLKEKIVGHFARREIPVDLKYIDPSYIIRSMPANATDRIYCTFLGQQAAHAAMSGKTGIMVTMWNDQMVYVPMELASRKRRQVDTRGRLWHAVLESTGQVVMVNRPSGTEREER
jgi:6-phosphofructokinase 1